MFFLSLSAITISLGEIFFGEKFLLILYPGLEQNMNIRNLSFQNAQNAKCESNLCATFRLLKCWKPHTVPWGLQHDLYTCMARGNSSATFVLLHAFQFIQIFMEPDVMPGKCVGGVGSWKRYELVPDGASSLIGLSHHKQHQEPQERGSTGSTAQRQGGPRPPSRGLRTTLRSLPEKS